MTVGWAVPPNATIFDGVWRVGEDIQPGIYRTIPPEDPLGVGCSWSRLSGLSGELSDIIASEFSEDPIQVEIAVNDIAFKSQNCGTWTKVE